MENDAIKKEKIQERKLRQYCILPTQTKEGEMATLPLLISIYKINTFTISEEFYHLQGGRSCVTLFIYKEN